VTGCVPTAAHGGKADRRLNAGLPTRWRLPVQYPQQLFRYEHKRVLGGLLHPEVLRTPPRLGACDAPCRGADQPFVDAHRARLLADRGVAQGVAHRAEAGDCSGEKRLIAQVFLPQERRRGAARTPGVRPGPHAEMNVAIFAVSVITGSMTIIERPGSLAIS